MRQSATPNFCSCQQVSTQAVGGVLAAAQHQIIFIWQILLAWGSPKWGIGGSVTKRQLLHGAVFPFGPPGLMGFLEGHRIVLQLLPLFKRL